MQLFSQAVSGTAKSMVTGRFEEMMKNGETWNGLGLLKEMDATFRDENAEQTAATLLHACRQFRDETLSSFLPRYQQLLVRSPSSLTTDKQKIHQLNNALNQTTQNYLIGQQIPDLFLDFVKYLSVIGSQIERVGLVKTRVYLLEQVGVFDDGTRGIAGGKLLGGKSSPPNYQMPAMVNNKDTDGDTKMTGVNKMRARWVSNKEIVRRKTEGLCLRCGKRGHLINKCNYLPAQRPETSVNISKVDYDHDVLEGENEIEGLKD